MRIVGVLLLVASCASTSLVAGPQMEQPRYMSEVFGPGCDPFADIPQENKVLVIGEPDYPKGPALMVTPAVFDDIVDAEVVERTMAVYGCKNHMHDQRDLRASSVWGVGHGHDLSIEGLSYFARTMAYAHLGLNALATPEGMEEYGEKSSAVREIVRQHLSDPDTLRAEYERFKPVLVRWFRKAKAQEEVRSYLEKAVIPYFTERVPQNVLRAEQDLRDAEKTCDQIAYWRLGHDECLKDVHNFRKALIALTPDYRVLQWMLRRKAEGDDRLVKAWGEILVDFSLSLDEEEPAMRVSVR